ncbi:MAG: hypothetical protein LBF54_01540 [Holosporaceae bacterium]|jgi:hypothetical protein|nr:hypothetical protein [Holosporaceae bacterium]
MKVDARTKAVDEEEKKNFFRASIELAKIWRTEGNGNLLVYRTQKGLYVILQSKKAEPLRDHEIARIRNNLNAKRENVVYLGIFGAFKLASGLYLSKEKAEEWKNYIESGKHTPVEVLKLKTAMQAVYTWTNTALKALSQRKTEHYGAGSVGDLSSGNMFATVIRYVIDHLDEPNIQNWALEIFLYPFSMKNGGRFKDAVDGISKKLGIEAKEIRLACEWWLHSLHTEAQIVILGEAKKEFSSFLPILAASALNPCTSCSDLQIIPNESAENKTSKRDGNFFWCIGDNTIVSDLPLGPVKLGPLLLNTYLAKVPHLWKGN